MRALILVVAILVLYFAASGKIIEIIDAIAKAAHMPSGNKSGGGGGSSGFG